MKSLAGGGRTTGGMRWEGDAGGNEDAREERGDTRAGRASLGRPVDKTARLAER